MSQRIPYAVPVVEPVGVYSDLAMGSAIGVLPDLVGSTGNSGCLVAACLVVVSAIF